MVPEDHLDLFQTLALAHAATIGPDGGPQVSPVWFEWDGDRLSFSLTTGRQKYRNIEREPRIAVSIVHPDNPLHRIELRGVAEISEDADRSFIDSMAKKYLGLDTYPLPEPDATRVIVHLTPERCSTFM